MSKPEFVEGCPCKDCTGEGLGWIKHKTKGAVWRRQKRVYAQYMNDWRPDPPR